MEGIMNNGITHLSGVFLFTLLGIASFSKAQESSWESPPVTTQLEMDDTLVPIGKGAVFVPSMTDPLNEPVYGVLENGRIVQNSITGHRIILMPGTYTVVYGSGTVDQMMQKTVEVVEAATTVVKPDWSGLDIDVIDETRTEIREYYDLFSLTTGEAYGIGQGVEEGLNEKLRTWILPPGTYKVVKPGSNLNAVTNFGTIRLLPGELIRATLVIDSKTMNFLGFGFLTATRTGPRLNHKWNSQSELSGNALLNYIPSGLSPTASNTTATADFEWLTDARYESGRHIFPVWSNVQEGLSLQGNKKIQKSLDQGEIRLTYIYRFNDYINPYLRFSAISSFFQTSYRFDTPTDYTEVNVKGDTLKTVHGANGIKLSGPFSPIQLKQGFGVTSTLVKTVPFNISLRSGFGARQTYARGAFVFNQDTNILVPVVETNLTGVEWLLLGDIRFKGYALVSTQLDLLTPKPSRSTWIYDGEVRVRFNITGTVSLLLTMKYTKDETVNKVQSSYQTLLRFSKYL
jgi:hypothetical protein